MFYNPQIILQHTYTRVPKNNALNFSDKKFQFASIVHIFNSHKSPSSKAISIFDRNCSALFFEVQQQLQKFSINKLKFITQYLKTDAGNVTMLVRDNHCTFDFEL